MKKFFKTLIIALIIIITVTYTNIVFAVSKSDINNLQKEQTEINNSITDAKDELEDVQKEKNDTLTQVNNLTSQISGYEDEIDDLESEISGLQTKIDDAETQIKKDEEEYQKQQEALNLRLVEMYEQGDVSYLDLLLSSEDLIDFISGYYMVSELASYDTEMLKQVEEEKEKIENEKKGLENSKASLDTAKKAKETKAQALTVAKKEKQQKVKELSQDEQKLQEEIEELQSHESSIKKKVAQMKEEYDRQLAAQKNNSNSGSKNNSGTSSNPAGGTSSYGFGWPVANPSITTSYGVSGKYWSKGYHTGIDFKAATGTAVFSIGDGQVIDAVKNSRSYGNYIIIYHGNNIYSLYAHGSALLVSEGQTVSKGQQIMKSGATGNVTGPHLHFEIRTPNYKFDNCVNPRSYLP